MKVTNKEYLNELKTLEEKMIKAEKWAGQMPLFSKTIIDNKITGEENFLTYTKKFRDVYFQWGISRAYYSNAERRTVTNYQGNEPKQYLWNIYVNSYSLYDEHIDNGLRDICKVIPVFFFDHHNSTFYVTDNQIEKLLEELNEWYNLTRIKIKEIDRLKEIERAKKEIERLQGLICGK